MHISPTTPSINQTHDVPVLVLASSDAEGTIHSRKFVARPSQYIDLIITARRLFGFKNDAPLVFGTSTLDVCRGTWIEIDESAYGPLLDCLDEVIVRPGLPYDAVGGDQAVLTSKGKTGETNTSGDSTPLAKVPIDSLKPKERQQSRLDAFGSFLRGNTPLVPPAFTREEPITRAEPPAPSSPVARPKSNFTPLPDPVANVAPKPTKSSRLLNQLDEISKQKTSKPLLSKPRQVKPEPDPEPERAVETEVEQRLKPKFRPASSTRQIKKEPESSPVLKPEPPRARQRKPQTQLEPEPAEEQDEEEDIEPPSDAKTEEASDASRKDDIEDEEDDDFWRFGAKSGPRSGSSRTSAESIPPPIHPSSNPKLTRAGTMISVVEVKQEPEEKKGKIRDARARLSTVNATQLPRASARALTRSIQDPEVRFMVTVYGPRAGQGADFRTRGGHKIKKVLESACKTFELPFEHSRLVLEDDFREETRQYYCDSEDTVGSCGIDASSRLLVQVDGMTDEELNKYGEEEDDD